MIIYKHLNWNIIPTINIYIVAADSIVIFHFSRYTRRKWGCYYQEKFILDNTKVDDHLSKVYKTSSHSVSMFVVS